MIFRSGRKNQWNSVVWQKKVMSEKNQGLQQEGFGSWKEALFC